LITVVLESLNLIFVFSFEVWKQTWRKTPVTKKTEIENPNCKYFPNLKFNGDKLEPTIQLGHIIQWSLILSLLNETRLSIALIYLTQTFCIFFCSRHYVCGFSLHPILTNWLKLWSDKVYLVGTIYFVLSSYCIIRWRNPIRAL
jgi:hypothetical protein